MNRVSPGLLAALDPLLSQALDLPPAELPAWLDQLQRTDPAMAGELRSLLREENRLDARGFLRSEGQADLFDPAGAARRRQRIGPYTLEQPLGRGGMGSVWLARRDDGRYVSQVAIKLLNLALLDPVGSERFRREGTALARLTHPNVAHLIDAGVTDGGHPYLVLEYVQGQRIDQYCDDHRLDPEARIVLFLQVLAAVAHAHAHLIVHRDLKPGNILVTADGSVKLLDFGIAKLLETETAAAERSELTDLGGLAMTPEYAAPEQALGGPVSTATDGYSLGVLLYILLAGRHPTGEGLKTGAEHIRAILDVEPLPLSAGVNQPAAAARAMSPERLRRMYQGDLDNILAKALKKDPSQRYTTAVAFGDDLGRYLGHEPVHARRDSLGYRARKFVRRNRAAVVAAGLTGAALIAATVVTTDQMLEARRQRDDARFEEARASAINGFMVGLLHSIAPSGKPFTMQNLLERGREILETDYQSDPRFVARMMLELANHYGEFHERKAEVALLTRADELASKSGDPETAAHASCMLGYRHAFDDEVDAARQDLDRASQQLSRVPEPRVGVQLDCLQARSEMASRSGQQDSALALAREAVAMVEASDTASQHYASALNQLAILLQVAGRFREALEITRRAAAVAERTGRGSTLSMAVLRYSEAFFLAGLGEKLSADSTLASAVDLAARADPQRKVPSYMTLFAGELALDLAHYDSAVSQSLRGVAEARADDDPSSERWGLTTVSAALIGAGRLVEARRYLSDLAKVTPDNSRWRLDLMRARMAGAAGDPQRAHGMVASLLRPGDDSSEAKIPSRHLITVVLLGARTGVQSGELVAAESLAQRALSLAKQGGHDARRSAAVGEAMVALAGVRLARGDSAAGRRALEQGTVALANGYGPDHRATRAARVRLDSLRTGGKAVRR